MTELDVTPEALLAASAQVEALTARLVAANAVHAAAKTAGIPGKPVLKEYGRSGFWEAVFGPSGQSLLGIFLGQLLQGMEGAQPSLHYPAGLPQLR